MSLSTAELEAALDALASDPERWAAHVHHDPDQRTFTRLALTEDLECWLICWMPGHDTGFHDHDLSSGVVRVVDGRVHEQHLTLGGEASGRTVGAGETFSFGPTDIHRVTHVGTEPATTLHAYSPPLRRMGAYAVAPSGTITRRPLAKDEELRPEPVPEPA